MVFHPEYCISNQTKIIILDFGRSVKFDSDKTRFIVIPFIGKNDAEKAFLIDQKLVEILLNPEETKKTINSLLTI